MAAMSRRQWIAARPQVAQHGGVVARTAFALLIVMQTMTTAGAQDSGSCPSIAGFWRSTGGVEIEIRQAGCSIASKFGDTVVHILQGSHDGGDFDYSLTRTHAGCTVVFYGRFTIHSYNRMTSHVYRTSKQCGFAEHVGETLSWRRIEPDNPAR